MALQRIPQLKRPVGSPLRVITTNGGKPTVMNIVRPARPATTPGVPSPNAKAPPPAAKGKPRGRKAPRPGRIRWLGSRYRLRNVLGDGGVGTVYRADDKMLDITVAVKVLHPALSRDRSAVKALKAEARTTMQLSHRYIVRLYDFQKAGANYYLVMEYVDGRTLHEILREYGRLPLSTVLQLVTAIADGLSYAHRRGILHNDLKPGNLMLDVDGVPKIIDFGIACAVHSAIATHYVMGTPGYMSPEQIEGDLLDVRTDIYALAIIAWELLAGREPFPSDVDEAHFAKRTPPRLAGVPEAVADVLARAMAYDRTERYPDIVAFADAFLAASKES